MGAQSLRRRVRVSVAVVVSSSSSAVDELVIEPAVFVCSLVVFFEVVLEMRRLSLAADLDGCFQTGRWGSSLPSSAVFGVSVE